MRLLNLGCGANRPQDEQWWNLDNLRAFLKEGTPERRNLDSEPRYIDHDIRQPFPFPEGQFDGIIASHVIEHFDCIEGVSILRECHRILRISGTILISVPNCSYFRRMYPLDNFESATELFGEPIYAPDGEPNFFGYGLWNRYHKAILGEDALWCYIVRAGFSPEYIYSHPTGDAGIELEKLLNRQKFSTIMYARK